MPRTALAFVTCIMIGGTFMAHAGNDHVTLDCADATLCDALSDAVSQAPALPDPLTLRLVVQDRSDHALTAYLEWQGAQNGRGDPMTLSVMDTSLRPSMLGRFIADLVRHSGLPH